MKHLLLISIFCFATSLSFSQEWTNTIDQPIELGQVHWLRNYDEALALSQKENLPVFLFFQEVPGCHTCSTFGNEVMSHPLIIEAIETHFIPLVIYNNKKGEDEKVLQKYNEPSWNNPVIRIINSEGKDIVKRHASAYQPAEVINTIQNALLASNQITPYYLDLLHQELSIETKEAILSMYCFWTGEKVIGTLPGVQSTQAGYMNGTEVVKVSYDPKQITYEKLVKESHKNSCADIIYTNNNEEKSIAKVNHIPTKNTNQYRVDNQDKYYLSKTEYKSIPMLSIQATKANALIAKNQSPIDILSPRQLAILELVNNGYYKKANRAKGKFIHEWNQLLAEK